MFGSGDLCNANGKRQLPGCGNADLQSDIGLNILERDNNRELHCERRERQSSKLLIHSDGQ